MTKETGNFYETLWIEKKMNSTYKQLKASHSFSNKTQLWQIKHDNGFSTASVLEVWSLILLPLKVVCLVNSMGRKRHGKTSRSEEILQLHPFLECSLLGRSHSKPSRHAVEAHMKRTCRCAVSVRETPSWQPAWRATNQWAIFNPQHKWELQPPPSNCNHERNLTNNQPARPLLNSWFLSPGAKSKFFFTIKFGVSNQ